MSCMLAQSCPTHATPWIVASQAPLSMGFFRQEYQNGLPFPTPGDLFDPEIEYESSFKEFHSEENINEVVARGGYKIRKGYIQMGDTPLYVLAGMLQQTELKRILQEAEGRVAGIRGRCWDWCSSVTHRVMGKTECLDVDVDKWVDEGVTVYRRLQKLSSYYFYLTGREGGQRNVAHCQQIRMRMGEEMLEAFEKGESFSLKE